MAKIAIDVGYSSVKIIYNNKIFKFPSAVSYAGTSSLDYGENKYYEFENEKYTVGNAHSNSFVTTDYKFLNKYAPLVIYHALLLLGIDPGEKGIEISTGLAISDWSKRQEFADRISNFEVNGKKVQLNVKSIIPQGAGVYYDMLKDIPDIKNQNVFVCDIGFNTINVLHFQDNKPIREKASAHVGAGVSTIVREFTKFLELQYNMPFSESEALKIYMKKRFMFNGVEQEAVVRKIDELKQQFVKQLFQSVLTEHKKLLATSDLVIIAGGGTYFLNNTVFPPNVKFTNDPYEFSNVRGYAQFL
jgi:plasmid segregation protein ParM